MKFLLGATIVCAMSFPVGAQTAAPSIDRAFAAIDADGNGQIDKAEFARFMQARHERQAKDLEAAFDTMDKDGNGQVSRAEAKAVPLIAASFDALDTDGSGSLSRTELRAALTKAQAIETSGQ